MISLKKLLPFLLLGLILTACVPPPRGGSGLTQKDGILFLASREGKVLALNPQSRSQNLPFPSNGEWVYPEDKGLGAIYGVPTPSSGKIYIGTFEGVVFALDIATGSEVWSKSLGGSIVGSAAVVDEKVFIAAGERLFALDGGTGGDLWQEPFKAKGRIWSTPVVRGDIIYVSSMDGSLYALDLWGKLLWEFKAKGALSTSPLILNNTIFIGSFDKGLYAVDALSGKPKWAHPFKAGHWFWTRPISDEGKVFAGALDKNFYAIDAERGTFIWKKPLPSAPSSAIIEEGVIVVASVEGKLYGIDSETGETRWRPFDAQAPVADLFADKGIVYVSAQNGVVYALEVKTGREMWSFSVKGK